MALLWSSRAEAACTVTGSTIVCTGTTTSAGTAARVNGGGTVTNEGGLTVNGVAPQAIFGNGNGNTLTNNGSVRTHADSADGLEAVGDRNTLVNTGDAQTDGASADVLRAVGNDNVLRNGGAIVTTGASGRGIATEGRGNAVTNSGTIATTGAGGDGIRVDGSAATVTNQGRITTGGLTADGVRVDADDSTLTNSGSIVTSGVEGRGVKVEGTGNRVVNSGSIEGTGDDAEGLYVISNAGQTNTILNQAGGGIASRNEAALRGRDGSEHVQNFGTIRTGVAGGAAVDLDAGNDSLLIGASSRIQGLVRGGGGTDTFALGGSANATFDAREIGAAAKYRDFERFRKTGTSTWTTANDNSSVMPWSVEQGTLLVRGAMSRSAMTVHNGATLGGDGTVGSIVARSGSTLTPGIGGIGIFRATGDVTIAAGTTYRIDLNNRFQSDRIIAQGKANIAGGTVQIYTEPQTFRPGRWTILTARQGVTGQFSAVDDLVFFRPILTKDANNVYLQLLANDTNRPPPPGRTPPLQPEVTPPIIALHHDNLFRAAVLCRLRCSSSDAMGAVPAFAADGTGEQAPSRDIGWGAWAKALGSMGRTEGTATSAAVDRSTGGLVAGIDGGLGTPYRLGIAAGYLSTSFDIDAARASGSVESFHIGAYGAAAFGAFTLRGGIAYAHHEIDLSRSFVLGQFQGGQSSTSADSVQVFGELGYTISLAQGVTLEPFAGLAHVHVSGHDVVENASPFRAHGEVAAFDTTYSTLGARLVATMPTSAGAVTFKGMLGWRHAFGDVTPVATYTLSGVRTPFVVVGAPIDRDSLVVEAGLNWAVSKSVAVGIMYDGAIGPRDQEHTLRGSLSVRF